MKDPFCRTANILQKAKSLVHLMSKNLLYPYTAPFSIILKFVELVLVLNTYQIMPLGVKQPTTNQQTSHEWCEFLLVVAKAWILNCYAKISDGWELFMAELMWFNLLFFPLFFVYLPATKINILSIGLAQCPLFFFIYIWHTNFDFHV